MRVQVARLGSEDTSVLVLLVLAADRHGVSFCATNMIVTVIRPDLAFGNIPEDNEEGPGGFLCVGDLVPLCVSIGPGSLEGTVELSVVAGASRINVYANRFCKIVPVWANLLGTVVRLF